MATTAGQELRPVTSLWWLPLLFGVVELGVGVFFVVSPHETLSTFTAIAGIFVLLDGVIALAQRRIVSPGLAVGGGRGRVGGRGKDSRNAEVEVDRPSADVRTPA